MYVKLAGQDSGRCTPDEPSAREPIKPFSERNPVVLGVIGAVVLSRAGRSARFSSGTCSPARGTHLLGVLRRRGRTENRCRSAGCGATKVGEVKSIALVDSQALVTFDVDDDIRCR